ncbi:unnamed protein product [Rotaria sordida]|uniref:Uncharacterized protein n=2 Tax=Rotaria sordida TaxID=392033 RepID=A0A813XIE7_9BILA|nr:unnamed protein product [Rotaria sordida]CAF0887683.1 unnamed protein product [Rotaria sordida]CAF0888401.1 unnamed protein product [Rotaria sordida]
MATSNVTEMKSDHVIAWLDKNMGVSQNNRSSKKDLASSANVDCILSNERLHDINYLIHSDDPYINDEQWNDLIINVLQMFTDEEKCIKFIDDNLMANKQPFLIVSGQIGVSFLPKIYQKLSGYIYVFCGQRHSHEWTGEYLNHIEIYDDETGCFAKVLIDIGIYYLKKGQEETSNLTNETLTVLKASQSNNNNDDQMEQIAQDANEG